MIREETSLMTGDRPGNGHPPVDLTGMPEPARPDVKSPEASAMSSRRQFSTEYKLKILGEAAKCTQPGEIKALLRREGLYSSYLTAWRRQRDEGALDVPNSEQGRTANRTHDVLLEENRRLQRVNAELQSRLRQAEVVIEVQRKVAEIVGVLLKTVDYEELSGQVTSSC
jgi:transposase-like protein